MKSPLGQIKWRLSLVALTICTILCSSCGLSNNDPVICSLEVEKDWVTTSGGCKVRCAASDPDGDELTYQWMATGGNISGQGPTVTWTAPKTPGTYVITVMVADGRGGEATMQLAIDVLANHPPVIESLTAESSIVTEGKSTPIECVASDPDGDELTYLWAATGGDFSGEGSAVIWTAPKTCAEFVVSVAVIDVRGGEASKELNIRVRKPG